MSDEEALVNAVVRAIRAGGGVIVVKNRLQRLIVYTTILREGPRHPETYRAMKTQIVLDGSIAKPEYRAKR